MYYDYGQNLISADGYELSTMNNLKELYVDDCCFDFEIEINEHSIIDDNDDQYPDDDDGDDDNNEDRYLDYIPVPQIMEQTIGTSIDSKKCTRPRVRKIRHARRQGLSQTVPRRIDKICSEGTIDIAMVSGWFIHG